MRIAILGWGSLVWDRRNLLIKDDKWYEDGPLFPIEFARISSGNRVTLVIRPGCPAVQVLYAISAFDTLPEARENLREREDARHVDAIGFADFRNNTHRIKRMEAELLRILESWNDGKNFDAVIWTDLGANFTNRTEMEFTAENIAAFVNNLPQNERTAASEYITNAPPQIRTQFRNRITSLLE